jgi:hypothetical protein
VSIAEAPTISVLIIVKDEPEIVKTLEILKKQCKQFNAECIIVDASEHRLDSIRAKHPWVQWIDYQQPIITECAAHRGNTLQYFCKNDKKMFCSLCILN